MSLNEIKKTVLANQIQIDNNAMLLAEMIFEDKNLSVIKSAAFWITVGQMTAKCKPESLTITKKDLSSPS